VGFLSLKIQKRREEGTMKKMTLIIMATLYLLLLTAGFGTADVTVGVTNTNTTTAIANPQQTQRQVQAMLNSGNSRSSSSLENSGNSNSNSSANNSLKDSGNSNVRMDTPRPLLAAPSFITGIVPGTVENNREWKLFCPSVGSFSSEKIHRMKGSSGWFSGNDVTVTEIEESRSSAVSLTCQMVWPATFDGVGAEVVVSGDTNSTQAAAVGLAMAECVDRGFPAIAMVVVDKFEGETKGRSIGLSGAASTIADTSGVAFVGGGMLGTNSTRINDYKMVRAMCLTSLTLMQVEEKKVVVEEKKTCDESEFLKIIKQAEEKIATCFRYCYDNMLQRFIAADGNMNAYACTKQVKYLDAAIKHYQMAELNYIHGHDIREHTGSIANSNDVIAKVEFGLASAIYARDGSIASFWKAPDVVVHEDKKNHTDKPVRLTSDEKKKVLELRRTLERYSTDLTL
jgi:hypothetical protein